MRTSVCALNLFSLHVHFSLYCVETIDYSVQYIKQLTCDFIGIGKKKPLSLLESTLSSFNCYIQKCCMSLICSLAMLFIPEVTNLMEDFTFRAKSQCYFPPVVSDIKLSLSELQPDTLIPQISFIVFKFS